MDENETLLHSGELCCDPGINAFHRTANLEEVTCLKCLRLVVKHLNLRVEILWKSDKAGKFILASQEYCEQRKWKDINFISDWGGRLKPVCGNCCQFRPHGHVDSANNMVNGPYCALDGHSVTAASAEGVNDIDRRCWLPDDRIPSVTFMMLLKELYIFNKGR